MTLQEALWQDPDRVSGAVCFRNTRIPVKTLFDHIEQGKLEQFFLGYPDVTPDMVQAVLRASQSLIESSFRSHDAA